MRRQPVEKLKLAFDRVDGSSLSSAEKDSLKTLNLEQLQLIVDNVNPFQMKYNEK